MCVDVCAITQQIHEDVYPIPCIKDFLDKLAHVGWFSKIDLAQGYNQVQITPLH